MSVEALRFHFRHALFNLQEQFSDWFSGIIGIVLFPFYTWLMSKIWLRFNSFQGNYTLEEVLIYVGITEILFMTFLRSVFHSRAAGDFSISLARPRSWLATTFSGIFGKALGNRLIFIGIFVAFMPFLGVSTDRAVMAALRLLIMLPILGVVQALLSVWFGSAQVMWQQTMYFTLPFSKIFLVLGGVFGPLSDFAEPWKSILTRLPPSDLFFQPAYFCLRGEFYGISGLEWTTRVLIQITALAFFNIWFFGVAKRHHQSYGG